MLGPTDALADKTTYDARWADGAVAYRLRPGRG
jgi:hypothetical protein